MAVSEPLFRLRDIHFGYSASQPILNGITFDLDRDERIALVGSNGCGKTTLLQLMVGLHKPLSGKIHAFGAYRQSEQEFGEVRARAGLLFQDPDDQLFCPTVAEDVAFGPLNLGKSRAEVRHLVHDTLAFLDLSGFAERITYQLSGGEKRLVTLATVLAMEPDVLLLDEPTNALDKKNRDWLISILRDLPQAMIIVSHDADFVARLATRTLHLEAGQLMASP